MEDVYEIERRSLFDMIYKFVDWGLCNAISVEIYPRSVESGVWIQIKLTLRSGIVLIVEGQKTSIVRDRMIKRFQEIKGEDGNPNLPKFENPPPPPPIRPKQPINIL